MSELDIYKDFSINILNWRDNVLLNRDERFSHLDFVLPIEKMKYFDEQIDKLRSKLN